MCAWAVSEGSTASADPTIWKIVDGKLYLNYDAGVQKKWERGVAGHIRRADKNWPSVLGKRVNGTTPTRLRRLALLLPTLYVAFVFIQSLFFRPGSCLP